MKPIIRLLGLSAALLALSAFAAGTCPAILNHTVEPLTGGKAQSMCQYEGRVVLVVIRPASAATPGNMKDCRRFTKNMQIADWSFSAFRPMHLVDKNRAIVKKLLSFVGPILA